MLIAAALGERGRVRDLGSGRRESGGREKSTEREEREPGRGRE